MTTPAIPGRDIPDPELTTPVGELDRAAGLPFDDRPPQPSFESPDPARSPIMGWDTTRLPGLSSAAANLDEPTRQQLLVAAFEQDPSLANSSHYQADILNRVAQAAELMPDLLADRNRHIGQVLNMSTDEYIRFKWFQQYPTDSQTPAIFGYATEEGLKGKLFASILTAAEEEYLERVGTVFSAQQVMANSELGAMRYDEIAVEGSNFDQLKERFETEAHTMLRDMADRDDPGLKRALVEVDQIDFNELKERPGMVGKLGNTLALTVETDTQGTQSVLIDLDPGTDVSTYTDAQLAYLLARAGLKHTIRDPDQAFGVVADFPGGKTLAGQVFTVASYPVRKFDDLVIDPGTGWLNRATAAVRSAAEIVDFNDPEPATLINPELDEAAAQQRAATQREVEMMVNPGFVLVNELQRAGYRNNGGWGDVGGRVAAASAAYGPELVTEVGDLQASLVADIEQTLNTDDPEGGPLTRFATETFVPGFFTGVEWFAGFTESMGLGLYGALDAVFDINEKDPAEIFTQAWEGVQASFGQGDGEVMRPSEFFGIEEGAAWFDGAIGLAGDPFTYLAGGGKHAVQSFLRANANSDMLRTYMRIQPRVRSAVNTISKSDPAVSWRVAQALSMNMSDDGVRRLLDAAFDQTATKDDVWRILDDEANKLWTPDISGRALHRATHLGVARWMSKLPLLSEEGRRRVFDWFGRLPQTTTMSATDGSYLNDMIDNIVAIYPNNPERARAWIFGGVIDDAGNTTPGLLNTWDNYRGFHGQRVGALTVQIEDLRRQVEDFAADPRRTRLTDLQARRAAVRSQLNNITPGDPIADALKTNLEAQVADLTDRITQLSDALKPDTKAMKDAKKKLAAAEREMARTESLTANIDRVRDFTDSFFERVAKDIGIWDDATGTADWSKVTGRNPRPFTGPDAAAAKNIEVMVGADTELGKRALQANLFGRQTNIDMPATMYDIIAYRALPSALRENWAQLKNTKFVGAALSAPHKLWLSQILWNPITMVRTHLDETTRMFEALGFRVGAQATVSPIVPQRLLNSLPEGVRRPVDRAFPEAVRSGRSGAAARYVNSGNELFNASPNYRVIRQGERVHSQAAERWINGTMMKDEAFIRWANLRRQIDSGAITEAEAKAQFVDWWTTDGADVYSNIRHGTRGQVEQVAPTQMFDDIGTMFNNWLKTGKTGKTSEVRDAILDAASGTRSIDRSTARGAQILRWAGDIPGVDLSSSGFDLGWDLFFGHPSRRRGAVAFQHYYDNVAETLTRRAERNGTLLTARKLRDILDDAGVTVTDDQARALLHGTENTPELRALVADGWITPGMIDNAAARYADRAATSMMYVFGTSSIAGSAGRTVAPFGRAQLEFWDWWTRRMFAPLEAKAPIRIPGTDIGKFSRPVGVNVGDAFVYVPLNARLASRLSHIYNAVGPGPDSGEGVTPRFVVDEYTFIPTRFDDSFWSQVTPTAGPLPSWLVEVLTDEGDWPRDFLADIGYIQERFLPEGDIAGLTASYVNAERGPLNAVASILGMVQGSLIRSLGDATPSGGSLEAQAARILNRVRTDIFQAQEIPSLRYHIVSWAGSQLREHPEYALNIPDLKAETGTWFTDFADKAQVEALAKAFTEEGKLTFKENVPWRWGDRMDDLGYVEFYDQLVARLPAYGALTDETGNPLISPNLIEQVNLGWELYETGQADRQQLLALADNAADVLWQLPREQQDLLIHQAPWTAMNMVRRVKVDIDTIPEDKKHLAAGDRFLSRSASEYREGLDEGWLVERTADEMLLDAFLRIHDANRRVIQRTWEDMFTTSDGPVFWYRTADGLDRHEKAFKKTPIEVAVNDSRWNLLERAGMDRPDDSFITNRGTYRMTGEQWDELFDEGGVKRLARRDNENSASRDNAKAKLRQIDIELADGSRVGDNLITEMEIMDEWKEYRELDSMRDMPEAELERMRTRFRSIITLANGKFTVADYNNNFEALYGPLDFTVEIPTIEDANVVIEGTGDDLEVVDGDTLAITAQDGKVRFRLIGLNQPDRHQVGFTEAGDMMQRLLDEAETVQLVQWKPDLYGKSQRVQTNDGSIERRFFVVLFVDGVPIFDETVFTTSDPRGSGVGSTPRLTDIMALKNRRAGIPAG